METADPPLPGSRVLAVDDDAGYRWLLSRSLESIGCSSVLCEDLQGAWLKAVEGGWSAVIVDLLYRNVPDGLAFIEKVRGDSRTARVPLVALTGGEPEYLERARALGADLASSKDDFMHVALPFLARTCAPVVRPDVLLVEDDEGLLDLYPQVLEREGLRVRTAASAGAAWRELQAAAPDAVLLDCRLPDGDGLALCRRIRDTPALDGLFIAILTSDGQVVEESPWLVAGADTCWAKPLSAERVAALLKGMLRRKAAQPEPVVRLGAARLDRARGRLVSGGLESDRLNYPEIRFLELFLAGPEVGRAAAADAALVGSEGLDRGLALNAFICRLRKKFPPGLEPFVTVHGKGFRLAQP